MKDFKSLCESYKEANIMVEIKCKDQDEAKKFIDAIETEITLETGEKKTVNQILYELEEKYKNFLDRI